MKIHKSLYYILNIYMKNYHKDIRSKYNILTIKKIIIRFNLYDLINKNCYYN